MKTNTHTLFQHKITFIISALLLLLCTPKVFAQFCVPLDGGQPILNSVPSGCNYQIWVCDALTICSEPLTLTQGCGPEDGDPGPIVEKSLEVYLSDNVQKGVLTRLKDIHPREVEAKSSLYLGDGLYLTLNAWESEPVKVQPSPFEAHGQGAGDGDGGPSTPYLFTYSEGGYYIENDVLNTYFDQYHELAKQWYEESSEENHAFSQTDYYKLRLNPTVTDEGVRLLIKEIEPEESHIDEVKLLRIIYPQDTDLLIDHQNNQIKTVQAKRLDSLQSCVAKNKQTCKDAVHAIDDKFIEGKKTDEITLSFDISSIDKKDLSFIAGDVLNVTIRWTSRHYIDYVGLIQTIEFDHQTEELALKEAQHSNAGDVLENLSNKDNQYAHTIPGENIKLIFAQPSLKVGDAQQESYVFVSSGFYHGLRTYLYPDTDTSRRFEKEIAGYIKELEKVIEQKVKSIY